METCSLAEAQLVSEGGYMSVEALLKRIGGACYSLHNFAQMILAFED